MNLTPQEQKRIWTALAKISCFLDAKELHETLNLNPERAQKDIEANLNDVLKITKKAMHGLWDKGSTLPKILRSKGDASLN